MIMRMHVLAAVLVASAAVIAAAQSETAKSDTKKKEPKSITLVGCVTEDEAQPGQFTLADPEGTALYRLSGSDVRRYAGQHVQIIGTSDTAKVKVRGGLSPSPNTAAQAGAIDPTRAAVAAQTETRGTGTAAELPTFTVKTVKPAKGNCPPQK